MILQALTAYYEQLVRQGKLSAPGWDDSFKVSYELRLNDAGQLGSVLDLRPQGVSVPSVFNPPCPLC